MSRSRKPPTPRRPSQGLPKPPEAPRLSAEERRRITEVSMAIAAPTKKASWPATIGKWLILVLSSGVVAGGIGAFAASYFTEMSTVRIENSKAQYEQRSKIIETFDSTNNNLLSKIAVFNTSILDGKKIEEPQRAAITESVIKAQIATNELEDIVPESDKTIIKSYKMQLDALGKATQGVDQPLALRPVFEAVAQLLPLHDQLAGDARASLKVRGAF